MHAQAIIELVSICFQLLVLLAVLTSVGLVVRKILNNFSATRRTEVLKANSLVSAATARANARAAARKKEEQNEAMLSF